MIGLDVAQEGKKQTLRLAGLGGAWDQGLVWVKFVEIPIGCQVKGSDEWSCIHGFTVT